MNKKIIAAGHICIDITPVFPRDTSCAEIGGLLMPGRLIHMNGVDVHTGGSVANTGLALKILGADVQLLGKVGNDALGAMIRDLLMFISTSPQEKFCPKQSRLPSASIAPLKAKSAVLS